MRTPTPNYDPSYYSTREGWLDFQMEAEALTKLARIAPTTRVLEVGCGSGELLRRLAARARLAVGVDLSQEGLRLARSRAGGGRLGRTQLLYARAESLAFKDGSFDAVVAQHLLEHLHEPVEALREWRRVLRPGGTMALVTPNAIHPDPALFHDPAHVCLFTLETLRSTLESAGFMVAHLSTLFPYLGQGRLARSLSIRIAPLARHLPGLAHSGRSLVAAAIAA